MTSLLLNPLYIFKFSSYFTISSTVYSLLLLKMLSAFDFVVLLSWLFPLPLQEVLSQSFWKFLPLSLFFKWWYSQPPVLIPFFFSLIQFSSAQSLSRVRLFATPWIAARQASLSITISRSSLRLTSTESVMPSSHLILCRPLLLLPPIPPSIRVFSNESHSLVSPNMSNLV